MIEVEKIVRQIIEIFPVHERQGEVVCIVESISYPLLNYIAQLEVDVMELRERIFLLESGVN